MVQCEMCGSEVSDPNRVKIEGAELDVCDECTDFGTEIRTESSSSASTKYSTSSSGSTGGASSSTSSNSTSSSSSGGGGGGGQDMFDDIDEVAQDYDDRIRTAREAMGISQEDLAKELNEKASLIRKLEHGSILPSDDVQKKLERKLDIDLTTGGAADSGDWESESSGEGYTLGDVVERKD